jgi:outer membrane protein TolC
MQQSMDAMRVALRVLQAITERHLPDAKDLEELKRLAPLPADQPHDELACDVIKQALQRREEIRSAQAAG